MKLSSVMLENVQQKINQVMYILWKKKDVGIIETFLK